MADCDCSIELETRQQGRVLIVLLAINAVMFCAELVTGILSESTGLIADSLDMLADATVYAIALFAVGREPITKVRAASLSGYFQVALAAIVAVDVIRRALFGSEPEPTWMVVVGLAALAANVACLILISRYRDGDVHMRASWIFSKNDVIANVGIVVGGGLVYVTGIRWPDLVVGIVIALVVLRGGLAIIADARRERLQIMTSSQGARSTQA